MSSSMNNLGPELERHMNVLCKDIGERHLGSEGEVAAAEYILKEFEAAGYSTERQSFKAPGWKYGEFSLQTESGTQDFPCFPCFYSCGGEARGEPVFLDLDHDSEPITPERFRDRIVFAHGSFSTVRNTNALALDLDWAGAKALIIVSPYQDTFSTKIIRQPGLKQLIVVTISKNTALKMARELKNGGLSVKVEAENFCYNSHNIVAGSGAAGKKGRRVVLGAHFDTTPGIEGAGDDASGIAILLVLARVMKKEFFASGTEFDLVAFTGEEYGGTSGCGLGAMQFASQRNLYLEEVPWMVEIDDVGTFMGHLRPKVYADRNLYRSLNAILSAWDLSAEYRIVYGGDSGPFTNLNIPIVFFNEDKPLDGNGHFALHSPQDNLDLIDPDKLVRDAEIVRACLSDMLSKL